MSKLDWWFAQNIIGLVSFFKSSIFDVSIVMPTILQTVFAQIFLLIKKEILLEKIKHKDAIIAAKKVQRKMPVNLNIFKTDMGL